ncbi:hypothetical protein BD408DRAFT_158770 [Parasitella parasitica]|nr:hypothetical protein BD408DRAFT_158770 [Parasitella parasitica]
MPNKLVYEICFVHLTINCLCRGCLMYCALYIILIIKYHNHLLYFIFFNFMAIPWLTADLEVLYRKLTARQYLAISIKD